MFDCHVHSSFSGDSQMDPKIAIKPQKIGLDGIAFTDHLDIDYPDYDHVFMIDFERYSRYMDCLKNDSKNGFKVLKGIEVGIQPHVVEETLEVVKKYDFDIVIASVHVVDKMDLHNGDFCKGKSQKESYSRYLEALLECIELFDDFDILGHIDLIRRYGHYEERTLSLDDYKDHVDAILKKIICSGKGIEVNASGYRYKLNSPMPDFQMVKRYHELGGNHLHQLRCSYTRVHRAQVCVSKRTAFKGGV